uniref:Uncharacterized protein n=1 Tax=Romanomermis culicivorax TaxID=13658 RepID=A0A915IX04_ROMCU
MIRSVNKELLERSHTRKKLAKNEEILPIGRNSSILERTLLCSGCILLLLLLRYQEVCRCRSFLNAGCQTLVLLSLSIISPYGCGKTKGWYVIQNDYSINFQT